MGTEINKGGRPRLYNSPEDFDAKVLEYHQYCKAEQEPVTWTGLALYLGFSSRQSIDEYAKYDGFSDSVKKAKTLVEWEYEKRLIQGQPAGPIFALKNMGWSDKQEIDHTTQGEKMQPSFDVKKLSTAALAELANAAVTSEG